MEQDVVPDLAAEVAAEVAGGMGLNLNCGSGDP